MMSRIVSELQQQVIAFIIALLLVAIIVSIVTVVTCDINKDVKLYNDIGKLETEKKEAEERIQKINIRIQYLQELKKYEESEVSNE